MLSRQAYKVCLEVHDEVDVTFLAEAEGGWIGGSASCCPKSSICPDDWPIVRGGYSYFRWLFDAITRVKCPTVDFRSQQGTDMISSEGTVNIVRSKRPILKSVVRELGGNRGLRWHRSSILPR